VRNIIAVDIETVDPNLKDKGNGAIRKDGRILGVGTYDGKESRYLPHTHPAIRETLSNPDNVLIMHNAVYDADWLQNGAGIPIHAKIADTMTRSTLIDQHQKRYNLDACCAREGLEGKTEEGLEKWWKDNGTGGDVKSNLEKIPRAIVEEYCIGDCRAAYDLYMAQETKIKALGLQGIADIESAQIPFILEMRKNGVRLDVNKIQGEADKIRKEVAVGLEELKSKYGITSLSTLKGKGSRLQALIDLGLHTQLAKTPTGGYSIDKDSLARVAHPISDALFELQNKRFMLEKTFDSALVDFRVGDRLHGTFKPAMQDDGGTVTGRYSASKPNLQQLPSKGDTGGNIIRSLFLPDEGCLWGSTDFSQVEYRLLAHYAVGPGAEFLRQQIRSGVDYHTLVQDMLGWHWPDARKLVKQFNFGSLYGMGLNGFIKRFMRQLRVASAIQGMIIEDYAKKYFYEYQRRMTYIKPTMNHVQVITRQHGSIASVGGRLHRFPPDGRDYAILNYLIQGSAADIMKICIRDAWNAGLFNVLKVHSVVHDEFNVSIPQTKEGVEAYEELNRIMVSCVELSVPLKTEAGVGKNWWDCSEEQFEDLKRRVV